MKGLGQRWQDQGNTIVERHLWVKLEPEAGEVKTYSSLMDRAGGTVS